MLDPDIRDDSKTSGLMASFRAPEINNNFVVVVVIVRRGQ